MGRPRADAKPCANQNESPDDMVTIFAMKGSRRYFDLVASITKQTGIPKSQLFRIAFRDWCIKNGHGEPPSI